MLGLQLQDWVQEIMTQTVTRSVPSRHLFSFPPGHVERVDIASLQSILGR